MLTKIYLLKANFKLNFGNSAGNSKLLSKNYIKLSFDLFFVVIDKYPIY